MLWQPPPVRPHLHSSTLSTVSRTNSGPPQSFAKPIASSCTIQPEQIILLPAVLQLDTGESAAQTESSMYSLFGSRDMHLPPDSPVILHQPLVRNNRLTGTEGGGECQLFCSADIDLTKTHNENHHIINPDLDVDVTHTAVDIHTSNGHHLPL